MTTPRTCPRCGGPKWYYSPVCHLCKTPADVVVDPNPGGLCACGCGKRTTIVRSVHRLYLQGHAPSGPKRRDPADRLWEKVDKTESCWLLRGTKGYGNIHISTSPGREIKVPAHRFVYELLVGPVPDGLVLDHLCRVKNCVNPAHLEPVTNWE